MRAAARSVLLLLLAAGPALGAQTFDEGAAGQRLTCTRLSGGPIHDLTLVINDKEKSLDVKPDGWLMPTDDTADVTFKGDTVEWFYMRGTAVLDRKTGVLDWDDTGEYEYLETIGHADASDSEDNYRGKMQCKGSGG